MTTELDRLLKRLQLVRLYWLAKESGIPALEEAARVMVEKLEEVCDEPQ